MSLIYRDNLSSSAQVSGIWECPCSSTTNPCRPYYSCQSRCIQLLLHSPFSTSQSFTLPLGSYLPPAVYMFGTCLDSLPPAIVYTWLIQLHCLLPLPTFHMSQNNGTPRDCIRCGGLVEHFPSILNAPTVCIHVNQGTTHIDIGFASTLHDQSMNVSTMNVSTLFKTL
jgi:hypothetical protein